LRVYVVIKQIGVYDISLVLSININKGMK